MWTTDNIVSFSIMAIFALVSLRLFASHREAAEVVAKRIRETMGEQDALRNAKSGRSAGPGAESGGGDVTVVS